LLSARGEEDLRAWENAWESPACVREQMVEGGGGNFSGGPTPAGQGAGALAAGEKGGGGARASVREQVGEGGGGNFSGVQIPAGKGADVDDVEEEEGM